MTEASAHNEQVKEFMRTEILESGVEQWKLQCINDTADGVDNTAGEEPVKCTRSEGGHNGFDRSEAYPAHGNVDQRRKPFRTVDPQGVDDDSDKCDGPDESQKAVAHRVSQDDQADRSISSGDQNENHHMINFFQHFVELFGNIECVVCSAGRVEKDHADNEDCDGHCGECAGSQRSFCDQRDCCDDCEDHSDKVSQGTARVFDS